MTVAVITDSGASLPPDPAAAAGIDVVPIRIRIGDDSYRDGDVSVSDILARYDEGVTTAAPTPGDFLDAINAANEPCLVVTVAGRLSSSHDAAILAARTAQVPTQVVDSDTAAGGQGLVVLAAAGAAAAGADLDDVAARARDVAGRIRLMAGVGDLEMLIRGGRVPRAVVPVARWIGAKPMFELDAGQIRPLRPARSIEAVIERITRAVHEHRAPEATLHCAALHAGDAGNAAELLQRVGANEATGIGYIAEFGPALVVHTGPGILGLAWWWEPRRLRRPAV